METRASETLSLQESLRKLAAFSAPSANGNGADFQDIARGLAEVLVRMLPAEFVYVRVLGPADGSVHEAVHSSEGLVNGTLARDIAAAVGHILPSQSDLRQSKVEVAETVPAIVNPCGEGKVRVCVLRIGLDGSSDLVAAGSRQPDFPTPTDLLLMRLSANQTAVVLQHKKSEESIKEADRRKDEFLATVAHELRNPLAPIRNAVQILQTKDLPEAESQWARDVIGRQVQHMTRLVDDLLDLSRITRGKLTVRKERIELKTVVNIAVEASRPNIEKWGHELTVALPAEPIYLDADPTRLEQVFLNLLNNAAKYTPPGTDEKRGHIWLTAQTEDDSVVIRVKDTGIGIRADMLGRIFQMFTQVDRSLGRSQEGLGIGLALVQRLVALHGGTIRAQSAGIGQGSEFIIRLPLLRFAVVEGENGRSLPGAPATSGMPSCRILVVDDNKDAANCLAKLLRKTGNEVHTAYDGLQAVEAAATFRPEVVLLDIGLPKIDGYDAARRIREQPGGGDIVLVAVTGWGQERDRRLSREAGFDYHLIKPIEPATLHSLLTRTACGLARLR